MSKSIKLKDDTYIDSKGVDYKHTNLETTLDGINSSISSINTSITNLNNTKENKPIRGVGSVSLRGNVSYLIAVKVFTTVSNAGGVGVVLGGYAPWWIGSQNINVSTSGTKITISSSYGACYITAFPLE